EGTTCGVSSREGKSGLRMESCSCPCGDRFCGQRTPRAYAQNCYSKPWHAVAFACLQCVEPGSRQHRRCERDDAHELFGVTEGRPERHHMIEDLVEPPPLS